MPDDLSNDTPKPLAVPAAEPSHFARNFLTNVVCELRYPTLFDIESHKPPTAFATALRKAYPIHRLLRSVTVGAGAPHDAQVHSFVSKDGWTVTLRAEAVTLETTLYSSFEDFSQRLGVVISAAVKVIDSDFFTRVGLRYQNALPYNQNEVGDWVNRDLVAPLAAGTFGTPAEYSGRVTGRTEHGGFTLMHGIGTDAKQNQAYVIDLDVFAEDILVQDVLPLLSGLHADEFSIFMWCLGPKAKGHLGKNLKGKAAK